MYFFSPKIVYELFDTLWDLPTPPLPDRINIFLLTLLNFSAITATSGSGPFGVEDEHIFWLGQPEKECKM